MATTNVQTVDHWYPPPHHESQPIQRYESWSTQLPTPHKSERQQRYHCTTTTLDLGHPAVKSQFCHGYIFPIKAPKARATGRQSMDHTCNMIQMIETMKGIFWCIKKGDASIDIGALADMEFLPDFDKMVAHPALRVPQKIPVDEDAILPYFPNIVEAVSSEFNATPFIMARNITFHEMQALIIKFQTKGTLSLARRITVYLEPPNLATLVSPYWLEV
jgi:hypothetical protein